MAAGEYTVTAIRSVAPLSCDLFAHWLPHSIETVDIAGTAVASELLPNESPSASKSSMWSVTSSRRFDLFVTSILHSACASPSSKSVRTAIACSGEPIAELENSLLIVEGSAGVVGNLTSPRTILSRVKSVAVARALIPSASFGGTSGAMVAVTISDDDSPGSSSRSSHPSCVSSGNPPLLRKFTA